MKLFIVVFAAIVNSAVCNSGPKLQLKDENTNRGYILEANNQTCITTVDTTNYKYDLWYDGAEYDADDFQHLICCIEPFSSDTIIPSLNTGKTSLEIIKMDFDILTNGKTNCSIYYGNWFFGEIPSTSRIPITGTELTIHPLSVRVLLGR